MTTPLSAPDWRKLSQEELDRGSLIFRDIRQPIIPITHLVASRVRRAAPLVAEFIDGLRELVASLGKAGGHPRHDNTSS